MSTDTVSHIAGDGKLGGVIEPNDATCHMENHTYTHGTENKMLIFISVELLIHQFLYYILQV